uniref:HTH OST-type domain-containing protein n=2 Tax=Triticum urartu TaxID=4572 RepID=A0A8R7Q2B2_TRIUA
MPVITAMYQALPRREYPLLVLRLRGLRGLSSHSGGGERWRGQPQQQQQQQEESKEVKVSVWWDFQKCQLPPDANPCRVAPRVTAALRAAGIRGPVEITAFGDVFVLPRPVQEVLAATGVAFSHVPTSGKDGSDRSFIADLVYWIAQNPPPAHFFLISGDKHFANILHRLRMSNYNILLACPTTEPSILCSAATIMWPWEALIKGEGFTRKHFNQPPDGLSCSWYGNYRGALDDPFQKAEPKHSGNVSLQTKKPEKLPIVSRSAVNGPDYANFIDPLPGDSQPTVFGEKSFMRMSSQQSIGERKCLIETKNEKPRSSSVPSSPSDILSLESLEQKKILVGDDPFLQGESKHSMNVPLQPKKPEETPRIPKSVVNCIRRALNSYPGGVNVEDLLRELKENTLFMYNGLYGFKNFSALLQAMPDYVKFIDPLPGDSQPAVVGEKSFNRFPSAQSNGEVKCLIETKNEKPPSSPSDILSPEQRKIPIADAPSSQCGLLSRDQRKAPPVDFIKPSEPPACHMEADMVITAATPSSEAQGTTGKKGLLERIQILWTGPKTIKPQVHPSHDATFSEGSSDVTSQEGQHNRRLRKAMKNCSTTDSPDVNGPDNSSAGSTSLSNDLSNNCSETDVKGGFANTKNHSGETVKISKPEKIRGSGESNKGIFSWAARWWSAGKSDKKDNQNRDGTRKDLDKGCSFVNSASGQQVGVEMFEKSYFWDALQQYLLTHHGAKLVSEAKAREELAHGLQKGCSLLKGLDERHIHQLVQLLISEKKWIKECRSETFHFQLTLPQRGTCAPLYSCKPEGSSSLANGSTTISSKLFPARNGNSQASCKGNEDQGNVDDFAWEELGPVSSAGDPHPETDKVVRYHPPTSSDDEFSDGEIHAIDEQAGKDSDAEFSEDENHTASQQARRDPSRSSLVEIIASWETQTGKDDGSPPRNFKAECSRSNKHYRQCYRPSTKQQQQQHS